MRMTTSSLPCKALKSHITSQELPFGASHFIDADPAKSCPKNIMGESFDLL